VDSSAIHELLSTLRRVTNEHGVRAATLVPDLALVGLSLDVADAAESALDLLLTKRPHRAYSSARACLEAVQRVLPVAVSRDYLRLGTRAWVYYQRKDVILTGAAQGSLPDSAAQVIELWSRHNPAARALVDEAVSALESRRGPDNFLGRNLADVEMECLKVLAAAKGQSLPPNAAEVNRLVYAALCRETHAGLRLQPRALRLNSDGIVEVVEREREPAEIERAVLSALESSLKEAMTAVEYRVAERWREANEERLALLAGATAANRPDYLPDLGRFLAEQGVGHVECVFTGVPLQHIREIPNSTLSVSLRHGDGADARLATFDFRGDARRALIRRLREEFPELVWEKLRGAPVRLDLPRPLIVTIRAVLGRVHQTKDEQFVPFVVRAVE
jgi:hypothetical protein